MVRYALIMLVIAFITANSVFSAVCDETYYANNAVLVTMQGKDVNSLTVSSAEVLGNMYDKIPNKGGAIYSFIEQYASLCDTTSKQSVIYNYRGGNDPEFSTSTVDRFLKFYPSVTMGESSRDSIFVFSADSGVSASDYLFYHTSNSTVTGTYAAAYRVDVTPTESGTTTSSAFYSMSITADTATYLSFLRTQWGEPPQNPATNRGIIVHFLFMVYKTAPAPDALTLTTPNGGETWAAGLQRNIEWYATGSLANVKLELLNNGVPTGVEAQIPNTGEYLWTIPNNQSNTMRVKVSNLTGDITDQSNADFTITGPPNNDATLSALTISTGSLSPVFSPADTSYTILFPNSVDSLRVSAVTNDANAILTINNSPDSTGSSTRKLFLHEGGTFIKVKVIAEDEVTIITYTITVYRMPNTVKLLTPNGGEKLYVDSSYNITWTSTGDIDSVRLDYSKDGESWFTITASTLNDSSYTWTVPNDLSSTVLVKITALIAGVSDVSNAKCSIIFPPSPNSITILKPNGGEKYQQGTNQIITWESVGDIGTVKFDYKIGDADWTEITSSTPNDHSEFWTIPAIVSTAVKIRLTATGVSDTSDAVFEITATPVPKTITVTTPEASQEFFTDHTETIAWETTGDIASVMLEYKIADGAWVEIAASTPNDSEFPWTTPANEATDVTIRISDVSSDALGLSAVFSLVEFKSITVLTPNGSEELKTGSSQGITWSTTGTIDKVDIAYTTGEDTWFTVEKDVDNDGEYSWNIPRKVSSTVKIRITDASGTASDVSDADFSIIPDETSIFGGKQVKGPSFSVKSMNGILAWNTEGISLINIYDLNGTEIIGIPVQKGNITWNGLDRNGNTVKTGIYFIRMLGTKHQVFDKILLGH
ncbi:MAG: cadherin-like beta sandwich domain-containing protein [Fibrobacteria bacterium]|nr:cadherin-like beta sandwich domain-containing protein [Fibrobacteria bacterium]